ncbi:hypothetical protein [Anaerotignum sp.]
MSNISGQLKKLNTSKLKMKNGRSIEDELKRHANILMECIQEELYAVYDMYSPLVYKRTLGLAESLYIGSTEIKVSARGLTMSIEVGFGESAFHENFFGEKMNTAILLNEGFQTHGSFEDIPYLGFREATHFIEKGIQKYKTSVNKPFAIKFNINNETRNF